jgi:hypothetical protein
LGGCRLNPQLAKAVTSRLGSTNADRAVSGFVGQFQHR